MAPPRKNTQVVVIPVGIGRYLAPANADVQRGRRRFEDLEAVDSDHAQLVHLFQSETYRKNGFVIRPMVTGTAGQITDKLNGACTELANDPPSAVLLFWSGHGETPGGGDLRLATVECCHPMSSADGFSPAELVNKLAASLADTFCLVLDVCQGGAADGIVAATAAQRFRETQTGTVRRMAALFSAQAFDEAEDGLFVGVLERVLRNGPSPEARDRIAQRGWGEFSANNRLLTMGEIDGAMQAEFDVLKENKPRVQTPVSEIFREFGLFPNPLYSANAPPLGVDVARRRWLGQDFDSHFLPKARGLEPREAGWFFSGRDAVSHEIVDWLHHRGDAGGQGLYVLTGSGGTGKSAIIGRMVALSDPESRRAAIQAEAAAAEAEAPAAGAEAKETLPAIESLDAALHLRNLDLARAAGALSELLGIPPPQLDQLAVWAAAHAPARFPGTGRAATVALDALDEASEPVSIAERLIQPLAARGWRFLVGTRRSAAPRGADRLLSRLGPAHIRDLDLEATTEADIAKYVKERLARTPGSPYADRPAEHATAIAARIAQKAQGRFLFARIAASGLLQRPRITLAELDGVTGESVGEALTRDLENNDKAFSDRFGRTGASDLLAALAWAEGEGLPLRNGLWPLLASALHPQAAPFSDEHAQWVLVNLGRYIIESGDGEQAVYRLFHESLNEHFRAGRDAPAVCAQFASTLLRHVEQLGGWDHANPYVVRHLPAYYRGVPAGLERLCTDPWYLRRALDLLGVDRLTDTLLSAWRASRLGSIEAVAKSVWRARVALSQDHDQLATQLHARLAGEEADALKRLIDELPRTAPRFWLRSRGTTLGWHAALETIQTMGDKVRALAFGFLGGASVIAVGHGTKIVLWNPRTGALPPAIDNEGLRVTGLAIGVLEDRDVLAVAAGGVGGRLVIRDAGTGARIGEPIDCDPGMVAMGRAKGRVAVVTPRGGDQYRVRTIDGREPMQEEWIAAAAVGQFRSALVAVVRKGPRYQVVNLDTGEVIGPEMDLPQDVKLMSVGDLNGTPVLCHVSRGNELGLRNLHTGRELGNPTAFGFPVRTIASGEVDGEFIVAAGNDTDEEGGYVAIRQPLMVETTSPPLDQTLRQKRILGVGLAPVNGERVPSHDDGGEARTLVLLFEGIGAVDPLTLQVIARGPADGAAVEVLQGAWSVPATIEDKPPRMRNGHGYTLRRDRPLEWPIKCEAWATIGGRLLQARGGYGGTV